MSILPLTNTSKEPKFVNKFRGITLQFEILLPEINLDAVLLWAQYHISWRLSSFKFFISNFDKIPLYDMFSCEYFEVLDCPQNPLPSLAIYCRRWNESKVGLSEGTVLLVNIRA